MFQDDTTGLRFGNFEVLVRPDGSIHELGRGGFGRTLLARHALLNTRVALKIIDERHALDETARGRFLKEAREQARLAHPGIARITDCGQVEGQLYYAVELCPDGHLRDLVAKAGPLNVADTLHILVQAAEALEFSHRNGVVHLDVKPSNLMLVFDRDGLPQVKLIDFGLVQQPAADASPGDHTGQPLFSAPFASPEQIRSRSTDGRSDIFSLGMTGWFLLTGHNPVEGAADAVIHERLSSAEYEPALPPQLTGKPRSVLARMIRKNATDRYDNSADLLADLRACLKPMPPLAGGWQHRRRSSGALAERFVLEKGTPARQGIVHPALDRETQKRVKVTLLRSSTMSQTVAQFHRVREVMSTMEGTGLLRVLEVREFNEGWAVVEESSGGLSLTEILRSEGSMPLARYAPLVWQLGDAMDTAFAAGLTSVLLDEAVVDSLPEAGRRGIDWVAATVRMPLAAGAPGPAAAQDGDVTLTGDFTRTGVSGAGVQLLARWVYFIVGGKNPPNSSLFSIKEYIAIPGLSDQGNQILARHLCGQSAPSLCQDMLRPLFAAEGLSWEGAGEKFRQARWGVVIQESSVVIEEIETAVTAAEKIVASCEPFAAVVPEEVKRCYAAASMVYEAARAARTQQTKLSQGSDKSPAAGQRLIGSLKESSSQARSSVQRAEAAFGEVTAGVERAKRLAEQRERRRRELVESLAEAWRRTEAAAKEAAGLADECRRLAPGSGATQLEELASRVTGLIAPLQTLHDQAEAAPESQWDQFEQQVAGARQVAADAREMARTCRSLLEKAKVEARRREEEARRRDAAFAALTESVRQAQQSADEGNALVGNITAATEGFPELQETSRRAESDGDHINAIVQEMEAVLTGDQTDVAQLERAQQQAATAAGEVRSLVNGMKTTLKQAQKTAGELRRRAEKFAAAAAALTKISAVANSTVAAAVEKFSRHGLAVRDGSPAAACLAKAATASDEAIKCHEQIGALTAEMDPRGNVDPDRIVDEAKRLAAECERQAGEMERHMSEAEYYIAEAERQARLEEEAARARAAAALAIVLTQVDREIKRAREAFTRAGQYAEIAAAVAAVTRASEAWSATQSKQRQIRQWQTARPPEAAADADFLQLISGAGQDLASFADNAERAAAEADAAAKEAAREAEARRQQELEASRRRAEEERRQREEEARRKAAEEEARRQALLASQREQEEQARRLADEAEKRRQAALAEQRRQEEEARLKAEAEAAEIQRQEAEARRTAEAEAAEQRRREEEAQRKAEDEARRLAEAEEIRRHAELAEQRRREEEARLRAEAAEAEQRRREEEAQRKAAAETAENCRREEEARRIAEAEKMRRHEEAAAHVRLTEEARRKAEADEQQKRAAEEKRREAETAEQRRLEAEAKRDAEAAEKRRIADEAARLKQVANAKRKAETEEKRRQAEAATKLKQEADAKRKADAEAKRLAEAEEKRRMAEEAAKLKLVAEAKRKAEAGAKRSAEDEEKRHQSEVAAELKRVSDARQKSSADQEHRQAEVRSPEADAATVVSVRDRWEPPRRGKGPLVAASAVVLIGGGAAVWWAINRKDDAPPVPSPTALEVVTVKPPPDPPDPPVPQPPVFYTSNIILSGDDLTKGTMSMKDVTLSGHDPAATSIKDDAIQFKTMAGSASRTVSLGCSRKGIKFDPATVVIRGDGDSQQSVSLSRESGRIMFTTAPAASPSFYSRVVLQWAGEPRFAAPEMVERTLDLTTQADAELPTGSWRVSLDDDEPGEGKPGKSGVIVDRRNEGSRELEAEQSAPAIVVPEGLPPLLYSVMDWQPQASPGEEKVKEQNLMDMLEKVRLPADSAEVRNVVSGLARTAAMPVLSYPLYLARRDATFYVLRPQRKDYLVLINLGIDRLAMAAAIVRVLQIPVPQASLNPATGASQGARIPWRTVSDRLAAARDALADSDETVVKELHGEITSSLNILSLILHDNWSVPPADAATWAAAWKETTGACSDVRIHNNGEITLSFKMSDVSTRTLVIKPSGKGQYPVTMPEGSGSDEKDTFSGTFTPVPQLPTLLIEKLPD